MVLFGDLFGGRWLFESGVSGYFLLRVVVRVVCDGGWVVLPPFTGKVVKSLLIRGFSGLDSVFGGVFNPKPIHVSPLLVNGRWLWKRGGERGVLRVRCGSEAVFHVGCTEDVAGMVFSGVEGLNGVELFNARWELVSLDIERYDLPSEDLGVGIDGYDRVVVEFKSPALLVDPYKASPSNPRFLPLAGVLFSYNIGDLLRMRKREHRWEPRFWAVVDIVNAVLHEHRRILDSIYTVTYNYDGRIGYGVGGRAVYYIVKKIIREKPWVKAFLENIIVHARIMGVGSSRANGFGHVAIRLE